MPNTGKDIGRQDESDMKRPGRFLTFFTLWAHPAPRAAQ